MKIPTDLQILDLIYRSYYETFCSYSKAESKRETKNYVPIDIDSLARKLDVDGDIVFSRLYYHLNKKYSYKQDDDTKVVFFNLRIGEDINCIHFPYMASSLADLKAENRKFKTATRIAIISLGIAMISVTISVMMYIMV